MAKKFSLGADGYYTTKVWDGTFTPSGKKHQKTIRSNKSSKDLELKVQAFKESLEKKEIAVSSNISLYDYATKWLEIYKAAVRPNTKLKYEHNIKKFKKCEVRISDLRREHWYVIVQGETIPVTIECYKVFRQVVESAITDRLLPKTAREDILDTITLPKHLAKPKRALTDKEKEAVFNIELKPMDKAFLWIIYGCGLRREEVLALTKNDIVDGSIDINKVLTYDGEHCRLETDMAKSYRSIRKVPMPSFLSEYLETYASSKKEYLFTNQNGNNLTKTNYKRMWGRIVDQIDSYVGCETELTAHVFRHNYCSTLCYQIPTISIKTVAQLMGDSEKVVLEVYNHVIADKEDKKGAIESALSVFQKKEPATCE